MARHSLDRIECMIIRGASLRIFVALKFCPKCGTRLKLKQDKGRIVLDCDNCSFSQRTNFTSIEELENAPPVKIVGDRIWPSGWDDQAKKEYDRFKRTGQCDHPESAQSRTLERLSGYDFEGQTVLATCGICG